MKYPYAEVQMRSDGAVADVAELAGAVATMKASGATDVVVMVHGWNNDMGAARRLYENLSVSLAAVESAVPAAAGRRIGVIGVLWPSVQWADEGTIAGGGAGVADPAAELATEITDRIEDPVVQARLVALIPRLDDSADARAEYLDLLRGVLPEAPDGDEDPPPTSLRTGDPDEVFNAARTSGGLGGVGAAAGGGAAGLSVGGFVRAARNLLNTTTYYTMKDRAGKVGQVGIAQTLQTLEGQLPGAKLHLVGHSFGARAATAAASATTAGVHSLSLLQGAYSHFGLATDYDGRGSNGAFHGVPGRLAGPMIITHTRNDRAVGVAYAIASRLARQNAAAVGDKDDPYGGMGSNGARNTPEADAGTLLDIGGQYQFAPKRVANLLGDTFVKGHSDVTGPQVAYAVLNAMVG